MSDSPLVHSVHFYDHDEALVSRLHNIVVSSLQDGSSVLIVATEEHREQLAAALTESDKEIARAAQARVQMFDARQTLEQFMVEDQPSDLRFGKTVGKLISEARNKATNARRGVTVFGEMVALLWSDGNKLAALELERMWNASLHDRGFHLHCAYPRWMLQDKNQNLMIKSICDEHSSVLGFGLRLAS